MFNTFLMIVLEAWDLWCSLFKLLPFGDPYIAIVALFVVLGMTVKMVAGGEPA